MYKKTWKRYDKTQSKINTPKKSLWLKKNLVKHQSTINLEFYDTAKCVLLCLLVDATIV